MSKIVGRPGKSIGPAGPFFLGANPRTILVYPELRAGATMKLSDGEKLILMMLCEIYEKAGIKGEIDPEFVREAIFSGNLWGLKWQYSGIFHDFEASDELVSDVVNILDMWRLLETDYGKLTPSEKSRVEKEAEPMGKYVEFRGFDGNHESEYISVARFLIERLDRFQQFKGRDLNAHMPTIGMHRRMLVAFEPIRPSLANGPLKVEDVIEILKARIHPDNRKERAASSGGGGQGWPH